LPFNHPIYRSSEISGVAQGPERRETTQASIFQDGRLLVLYTFESDIGDGIEDADVHGTLHHPGGGDGVRRQRGNLRDDH
jgi:hypothetical protein